LKGLAKGREDEVSLTKKEAEQNRDKPAVLCCRREAGTVLSCEDFENPAIFAELQENHVLKIPQNSLTIGEAMGLTLNKVVDALTTLTPDIVDSESKVIMEKESYDIDTPQICKKRLEVADFEVHSVVLDEHIGFDRGTLRIPAVFPNEMLGDDIKSIEIDVIEPTKRNIHTNMVLDVIPIQTKVLGELGEGITHRFTNVVVIITGVDEAGKQMGEPGSSDGILSEKIRYNRPGAPSDGDILIRFATTIREGKGHDRLCVWDVHRTVDNYLQEIRKLLKSLVSEGATRRFPIEELRRPGRNKLVYVKQLLGQGAMHDNLLFPWEPCGVQGAQSIMDLGDMPLFLSANQVRDGALHCLQCVTPSSKETTIFFQTDPLLLALVEDPEFDFVGMVCIGSPQTNSEKRYVTKRLGEFIEALNIDAAVVVAQGFGNNHIDWAWCIEEIGKRDIAVVGSTMAAVHCPLVSGNEYMDALVEHCHDEKGRETRIIADNLITEKTAQRIIAMLKNKLNGFPIKAPIGIFSLEVAEKNDSFIRSGQSSELQSEIPIPLQNEPPWAFFEKDLKGSTIAFVSAAGIHMKSDEPFQLGVQDATFRTIPGGTPTSNLTVTHGGYDNSDAIHDINVMFPLDRLRELINEGFISAEAPRHFGFMGGGGNVRKFEEMTAPVIADAIKSDGVDAVVLTAG
jgi:D-proline reductase (dithiol) PrdA